MFKLILIALVLYGLWRVGEKLDTIIRQLNDRNNRG